MLGCYSTEVCTEHIIQDRVVGGPAVAYNAPTKKELTSSVFIARSCQLTSDALLPFVVVLRLLYVVLFVAVKFTEPSVVLPTVLLSVVLETRLVLVNSASSG